MIAENVARQFEKTLFTTRFYCPQCVTGDTLELQFLHVVSRVAGKEWITGVVLNYIMSKIVGGRKDVMVIDSLHTSSFNPPAADIRGVELIVHPQNIDGNHWVVTVLELLWEKDLVKIHMYNPSMSSDMINISTATWQSFTIPMIERWLQRDHPGATIGEISVCAVQEPKQAKGDGHNCGFLCIAFVNAFVNDRPMEMTLFKHGSVPDSD